MLHHAITRMTPMLDVLVRAPHKIFRLWSECVCLHELGECFGWGFCFLHDYLLLLEPLHCSLTNRIEFGFAREGNAMFALPDDHPPRPPYIFSGAV